MYTGGYAMAAAPRETALDLTLAVPSREAVRARVELEVLQLFDECHGGVQRYVRSFGIEAGDCEDVVQETFLALFRHLLRGGGRANLRGWIFRVARNLALKQRERQRRKMRFAAPGGRVPDRIASASSPEERLLADQRQAQLHAVVGAPPPPWRRGRGVWGGGGGAPGVGGGGGGWGG
ncbi:MAG: sigma-70 family RNA polymerase sigma factor, partial [Acidobacteria bacterium]|nr:sigma-70 family RNA polymerase sigma factor [Acidobacteriota bacterium]